MNKTRGLHQLIPLGIIFALALAALIVGRQLFVPDTFGEFGHYRAAAVDEEILQDVAYAGWEACTECHAEVVELKAQSRHAGVSCEACHGPAASHIAAPDEVVPKAPRGRDYCPLCHGYNPARPTGFPQILPMMHNPGKPCMSCHTPHNPTTPRAPEDCSACHRGIANTKLVSHHATLECTQCHVVPAEHKNNPRQALASKPENRSTCGTCHATEADSPKAIPRIDLASHNPRYKCWDCHYPHNPEAS